MRVIDDIREGINGRPTELSKMLREFQQNKHEELLDRIKGNKPQYHEDYFRKDASKIDDQKLLTKLDSMILNAKNKNDEKSVTNLSLLHKTLKTVLDGEKECSHLKDDKDLLFNQMSLGISV